MKSKDVLKFAIENGYDNIEYMGKWKDFEVYIPTFQNLSEIRIIGYPQYYLIKDDHIEIFIDFKLELTSFFDENLSPYIRNLKII